MKKIALWILHTVTMIVGYLPALIWIVVGGETMVFAGIPVATVTGIVLAITGHIVAGMATIVGYLVAVFAAEYFLRRQVEKLY